MRKTALIFDSTAIIDEEIVKKYDITFVSMNVAIDGVNHRALDIDDEEFRKQFHNFKNLKSGSPSILDFEEAINAKFDEGYKEVIVLPLASGLSATFNIAVMAREGLSPERKAATYIHESNNASIGMDLLMHSLVELLDTDPTADELLAALEARAPQNRVLFEIDNLRHLFRGGRLNPLKYIIGTALKIKPLVEFKDGELKVIAQNRSRRKTMDVILGKIDDFVQNFKNVYVGLFTYDKEDNIFKAIHDIIKERWPHIRINFSKKICPIFTTHVGVDGYSVAVVSYN
jgi:DegV family protein with EDD domain